MKIISVSDTHNQHSKITIPECDLLIHAGDWTGQGFKSEVEDFAKWLDKQPAKHIVVIPGNHELIFEKNDGKEWFTNHCSRAHLLIDELVEIEGVKIWGSPITPWFLDWAYNRHRGEQIQQHWDKIPSGIDILITHGPPHGILDTINYADGTPKSGNLGCYQLLHKIKEIKPALHFFGHIHASYGEKHIDGTSFYNSAICDEIYAPTNGITTVYFNKNEG